MNLPNKITVLRMVLVPVFILFMLIPGNNTFVYIAFLIYILASFTDFLDGFIARKYNLVTDFGKVMDPLADKVLVASGFIILTGFGKVPAIITLVVILRDYVITAIREIASKKGVAIAAVWSGKIKTVFQLIGVSLCIIDKNPILYFINNGSLMTNYEYILNVCGSISIIIAFICTIWSLFDYIIRFSKYINIEPENSK